MSHDDLQERVLKFSLMELPGQPRMMHMGTAYLVNDLATRVRELEAERDDYKAQAKEYWDIGLKREQERDAARALLREANGTLRQWAPNSINLIGRINAALAGSKP